jgi:hypothetical protein
MNKYTNILSNCYHKLPRLEGSRLAFLIVITGICLRLIQYLFNRSLWWDESLLALNIINTPLEKLFEPLGHNQAAPPGFLFLERFWVWVFNAKEYALRLVPLLAGLASLCLFFKLARNWLSQKAYVLALLFFAFSHHLIYYSAEVKQYSLDVFSALLLYYLFGKWISGRNPKQALFLLSLAGGLAVWFSHPIIFILSGLGLYAFIHHLRQNDYRKLFALVIPGTVWLLSFSLVYFLVLERASASTALNIYWDDAFLPFPPSSLADLKQAYYLLTNVFRNPGGLVPEIAAAGLFILGCISWRHKQNLWPLLLPILITLAASALHRYPFSQRLILFILPALYLLIAQGLALLMEKKDLKIRLLGYALLAIMLIGPAYKMYPFPFRVEESRPLIQYLASKKTPGDFVYLYYGATAAFDYYRQVYKLDIDNYVRGVWARKAPQKYKKDIEILKQHQRVWVLFSHVYKRNTPQSEEKLITGYLDQMGIRLEEHRQTGASLYLFGLRPKDKAAFKTAFKYSKGLTYLRSGSEANP